MADTTFASGTTIASTWLNDVNDLVYHNTPVLAGTDPTSVSDQTSAVQAALNALPSRGGKVIVPRGVNFNLQSLTLRQYCELEYYMNDDLSRPNPSTTLGTNELVCLVAHSTYTGTGSPVNLGIVNEWRHTATFHPGIGIDVRDDVTGHDTYLGSGQSRTDPVRASYNIWKSQVNMWQTLMINYASYSQYSGIYTQSYRNTVVLDGVGSSSGGWTVPTVGTTITGKTSGAKGYVLSIAASSTTVLWISGKFQVGEKLTNVTDSTATVTTVTFSAALTQPLVQSLETGNWSVGLSPGNGAPSAFAVGGTIAVKPSMAFSQYIPYTVTNPGYLFTDATNANGYQIIYDCSVGAASRRIWLTNLAGTTKLGVMGATRAKTAFSHSALIDTSAINIASITNTATGKYTVTFTNAFTRADYAVCIGSGDVADFPKYKNVGVSSVEIWNYNSAGTLTNLVGQVSVVCVGGDI